MTAKKIVLVEDSERYIEELKALITDRLIVTDDDIEVVRTEAEFYGSLTKWEEAPPSAFVVDVMIPFQTVGDSTDHVPADVREKVKADKFYRAGIRCVNALLKIEKLRNVRMIIHSILEKEDLESDPKYPIPARKNVTISPKEANTHGIIDALAAIPGLARQTEHI